MNIRQLFSDIYDLVFRMLPHRAPTGLIHIGNPGPYDPVLVTGNYTLTLRRLQRAMRGQNAWVLAADSKGINVWCAAGGGHLTHHDIIAVIRTSGIDDLVNHRQLLLPQLGATGIERRKITAATGWEARWGPARMEDLPAFLRHGQRARPEQRFMRFPLHERLEFSTLWLFPSLLIAVPVAYFLAGWPVALGVALSIAAMVFSLFGFLPWIRLRGRRRWGYFLAGALAGILLGAGMLSLSASLDARSLRLTAVLTLIATLALSIDFEGTTPWYGSAINTFHNVAHIELLLDACTGQGDCVVVCPKGVFRMNGELRKVALVHPDECVQCGACIVQCPSDALRFRYDDGRIVEPATVRATRLNMLGRRTVSVPPGE